MLPEATTLPQPKAKPAEREKSGRIDYFLVDWLVYLTLYNWTCREHYAKYKN